MKRRNAVNPRTLEDAITQGLCIGPLKDVVSRTNALATSVINDRFSEAIQAAQGHRHTVKILRKLKSQLLKRQAL